MADGVERTDAEILEAQNEIKRDEFHSMHSAAYRSTYGLGTIGRLVAVFGISGVGKTTLIGQFVRTHKDWQALSASKLLARRTHLSSRDLRLSSRLLIESNQFSLADAILRQRTETPQVNWLLDAHSVIDNDQEFIAVSPQAITRIDPDSLIFIQDDAKQILRRRADDEQRHRPLPSTDHIEEEQALALQTCLLYSKELKLKLHQISAGDAPGFAGVIASNRDKERNVKPGPWDDWLPGVLSKKQVKKLIEKRFIRNASTNPADLDYSSLDLRLDNEAYQLKACVKGFERNFVGELLEQKLAKPFPPDRDGSYLLKRRHSYLFKLMEQIQDLKGTPIYGSATAKSSIGRVDVLARLIVDGMNTYDGFEPEKIEGGDMLLEVTPMTFDVRVKPGIALTQLRLYKGPKEEGLIQGDTLLATVFETGTQSSTASLSVNLSPDRVSGCDVCAFSAPLKRRAINQAINLWKSSKEGMPEPWRHWKFEKADRSGRLRIVKDRFYIIRSREKIHLPKGIAVYCRASDETIGEMRIHYAGFVHPFFGFERTDGTRGTPLIFEVRGHDIDVSLRDREKMAMLEFYRMSEDAKEEKNKIKKKPTNAEVDYGSQSLQLSKFFAPWPKKAQRATDGTVTPK